ncbi:MAG: CapA family protein [Eubacteriales bacterium]|nr:CapA family protein [Eubacteriales bacterium]
MGAEKSILFALICALCLTGCGKSFPEETHPTTQAPLPVMAADTAAETTVSTEPEEERFLLTFVGDCTLGANPKNTYADVGFPRVVGEDYAYPFRNVVSFFEADDATFVNLEGTLTDVGNPADKTYTFRGSSAYSHILTDNSVEVVTLANNHSFDYGQAGYDSTRTVLEEAGIPYAQRDSGVLIALGCGLKVGLYGMVYYKLDVEDMKAEIASLREQGAELVIVAPHWGVEGSYRPTQLQTDVGHAAVDAGADIVWGSHPHVLQPIEEYGDGIIYYSMGNFCFGGNSKPEDFDTVLLQQEVIRDPEGQITLGSLKIVPCSISSVESVNNYQPTPMDVDSQRYARVLSKLDGSFEGPNLKIRKIGK